MRAKRLLLIGSLVSLLVALTAWAALAGAEVEQKRGVRVFLRGEISPDVLPRQGRAPVAVSVAGRISSAAGRESMPQLQTVTLAINREGRLSTHGIPLCRMGKIDPSTTSEALQACGDSLVGKGSFSADVRLPEQSPFPSQGEILAFNGRFKGKPAVLAHIYGTQPVPTSYVLPFVISSTRGTFGTTLKASLPRVTGEWGFVTGIAIRLARQFVYRGERRSFLVAGCPAPRGFTKVAFPLLRADFGFEGNLSIVTTLTRTCIARG